MPSIVVASKNPVKVQAAQRGFQRMFPEQQFVTSGITVPSGVSDQPMTSRETLHGAITRAQNARQHTPQSDFWVGIEGGVELVDGEMEVFAWIVVLSAQRIGKGRTGSFFVPQPVRELVQQGVELGDADDRIFGQSNSKQQNGSVGLLTDNVLTRTDFYEPAVILALIPFKNLHLTF